MENKPWYEKYAEDNEYTINPATEVVNMIVEGLEFNKQKYGARYCPCKMERSKHTICPCKELRETGHCHCTLFQ